MSATVDRTATDQTKDRTDPLEAWFTAICMWIIAAPVAIVVSVVAIPSALLDAWVGQRVWAWLVTPSMHAAVPPFALFVAADLLLSLYARPRAVGTAPAWSQVVKDAAIRTLGFPVMVLSAAWILARFLGGVA